MDRPCIDRNMYKLAGDCLPYKLCNYHKIPDRDLYIFRLYMQDYADIPNLEYIRVDSSVVDQYNFQDMNKRQFHRSHGNCYSVRMDWDNKDQQLL